MAAPTITATAYDFSLTSLGNFDGVLAPTNHEAVRNNVGTSTITLLNTSANRTLLGNANLYLIHVHYTTPAGNARALAQVVFTSADTKEQINMSADRIEISGPDLMIEWQQRRLYDAIISFGYGDPRVGDSPLTSTLMSETAIHFPDPVPGGAPTDHFSRWVIEVDNTTGGKTQAQISTSSTVGGTIIALFDSNYFGEDTRWSNGLPDTSSTDISLYSSQVTDKEFEQLFYFSGLDDDGWDIVPSAGSFFPLDGTADGTYSSAYGDNALQRLQFIALQAGASFYMPLTSPTREIVWKTGAVASGVTLSNDGTTGTLRGHIVGGMRRKPNVTRYTRMQVIGPGAGVGALRLAAGRTEIESLASYPDATVTVDWQNSVLYATSWESVARSDSPPVQFSELRSLNDYDESYAAAAVELYKAGLQRIKQQQPGYEYASVTAYLLGYDIYPYHSVTVNYTDRDLSGTWYTDRVRRNLSQNGIVLCDLTLMSSDEAGTYLTPHEKIVQFSRATWELAQSTNASGGTGGTFAGGGTSGGGAGGDGMVAHDINGAYHTGMPLEWSNVDAAAGDLEDLGARAHSSLQSINPDDHHDPVTAGDGIDLTGQQVAVDAAALAGDALQDDGNNNLAVNAAALAGNGLTELGNNIQIGTPGTLSNATSNGTTSTSHTHAITASSNPGAASSLLESDSNGYLQLQRLGVGRAPAFPIHVDSSGQQLRLDYSLGSHFGVTVGNGGATTLQASGLNANLTLDVGGNVIVDPDGKQVDPFSNYDVNLGALNKKYLSLHAAELWVETLVAQNTIATIGGRILVGPTTKLTSDLSSGSSTIEVEHNEMASGDRVYMEADGKVEFMAITSSPSGSGPYTYTVTRNLEGAPTANEWYAGDAVFNTGTTGDGFIDLYSVAAVNGAGTVLGPAITGNVRNSSTYNDWSEHWSIGNLRGNYGYSSDTYGAAFGKYAASSPWLAVDATNGFRVMYGTTPEQLAQWDTSGNILIGKQASGESNVYITSSEVQLRTNTVPSIRLKTDGTVFIGENANSAATISHAVFASTQFYNSESMGAGDFLLGQNSASTANIKWDAVDGQFSLRDGTTNLVTLDTDGITIDSVDGAGIPAAYDDSHAVTWRDGTRYDAGISGGGYEFASVHQESYLALNVDEVKSGSESYLYLRNTRVDGSIMAVSADKLWFTNEYARAYLYQKHLATSSLYSADSFSAGTYTVDANTSFGIPDDAVAVEVFIRGQWNTASPGSGSSQHRVQLRHGTSSFTTVGEILAPGSSKRDSTTALVELDSLGRFQFVVGNGTVDQFWIIVTGYYI